MKKNLFILVFILLGLNAFSQSKEHLTFKGVPIDGKLSDFVVKMKAGGIQYVDKKDGVVIMKGEFAGYSNCIFGIASISNSEIVYKIIVFFAN